MDMPCCCQLPDRSGLSSLWIRRWCSFRFLSFIHSYLIHLNKEKHNVDKKYKSNKWCIISSSIRPVGQQSYRSGREVYDLSSCFLDDEVMNLEWRSTNYPIFLQWISEILLNIINSRKMCFLFLCCLHINLYLCFRRQRIAIPPLLPRARLSFECAEETSRSCLRFSLFFVSTPAWWQNCEMPPNILSTIKKQF